MSAESLSLPQRLALVKFYTDALAKLRASVLLPQSSKEMPSGTKVAAMFADKVAAWVNVPQPAQKKPYVKDQEALLGWAQKNYPDKVEPTTEIVESDDLIAHLAEHFPSALREGKRVQPAWVSDILAGLVSRQGYYATITGEKLTEVPGIVIPEPEPAVPHVTLEDDAAEVIGAAWRAGDIPVADLLALPAGGETE